MPVTVCACRQYIFSYSNCSFENIVLVQAMYGY